IGTISPDTKLEIAGSTGVTSRLTSISNGDVIFDFKRLGSDWRIRNSTGLLFFGQSSDDLVTVTDVLRLGGASLTPAADNFVTLGSTSFRWTQVCAVNGTINTSDERLKKDVTGLGYGLDALMMLKPVTFRWKEGNIDNGSKHLGFLAQDLQKVLPEVVVDHEWKEVTEGSTRDWTPTSTLGVNYAEITPVLVKAVQEQQQMIEQLQNEIDALKLEISKPTR
ncbi:MAG: tail fiber domain-containing protein, partial [Bacteroidetes bacterium]|nr:tail fiber domain-containing protein [Bacteroidota bacterium]